MQTDLKLEGEPGAPGLTDYVARFVRPGTRMLTRVVREATAAGAQAVVAAMLEAEPLRNYSLLDLVTLDASVRRSQGRRDD